MADHAETASQARSLPQALQAFIQEHPLAVWGGLWSSVVVVAGVALVGIFSAGPGPEVEEPSPSPQAIVSASPAPRSPQPASQSAEEAKSSAPIWLYLAILGGCAVGSLLIFRSVVYFSRQKSGKHPKMSVPRRRKGQMRRPGPDVMEPVAVQPEPMMAQPMALEDPIITIVPTEEDHPLDWGENNLAEIMDIRKRYSLTSLLRQ